MAEWSVEFCNAEAKAELDRLSIELRAKFERIVTLIKLKGLQHVREPYIKHLEGKLWEMRMMDRDGIARSIYVTAAVRRIVILHTFTKKTDKTPRRALEIARIRAGNLI
jgi:phage-related protein